MAPQQTSTFSPCTVYPPAGPMVHMQPTVDIYRVAINGKHGAMNRPTPASVRETRVARLHENFPSCADTSHRTPGANHRRQSVCCTNAVFTGEKKRHRLRALAGCSMHSLSHVMSRFVSPYLVHKRESIRKTAVSKEIGQSMLPQSVDIGAAVAAGLRLGCCCCCCCWYDCWYVCCCCCCWCCCRCCCCCC